MLLYHMCVTVCVRWIKLLYRFCRHLVHDWIVHWLRQTTLATIQPIRIYSIIISPLLSTFFFFFLRKKSLEVSVGLTLRTLAHAHTPYHFSVNYILCRRFYSSTFWRRKKCSRRKCERERKRNTTLTHRANKRVILARCTHKKGVY